MSFLPCHVVFDAWVTKDTEKLVIDWGEVGPPRVVKRESTTFLAQLTIEPYSGVSPSEGFKRYEARAVLDRLAAQILRPPQEAAQ